MTILPVGLSQFSGLATSGTYDFTVTRDDIIRLAMKAIGKLGANETPAPSDKEDCGKFLNMLVKQWMGKQDFAPGLKMWTRQRGVLFLANNQYRYELGPTGDRWAVAEEVVDTETTVASLATASTITVSATDGIETDNYIGVIDSTGNIFWTTVVSVVGSVVTLTDPLTANVASGSVVFSYTNQQQRPLEILTYTLRDIERSDTPLRKLTLEEYESLPSKTQPTFQSDPTACYYESQLNNGVLYVDVGGAQDTSKYLYMVFLRPIQNFDNPLDVPEYSQEWYLALVWGLAKQIAPLFNQVWTKEMDDNHDSAIAIAREAPAETTAIYFQPNADVSTYG